MLLCSFPEEIAKPPLKRDGSVEPFTTQPTFQGKAMKLALGGHDSGTQAEALIQDTKPVPVTQSPQPLNQGTVGFT